MTRSVLACALLALVLGGCAQRLPLADAAPLQTADAVVELHPVPAADEPPTATPAAYLRLASDEGRSEDAPAQGPEILPLLPWPEPLGSEPPEGEPVDEPPAEAPVEAPADPAPATAEELVPLERIAAPVEESAIGRRLTRRGSCAASCRKPCCERGYVGIAPSMLPGLGGGIEWGVHLQRSASSILSFEVGMQYQDLWREFSDEAGDGEYAQARAGLRLRYNPRGRGHPTLRFGLTWFEAEGTPIDLSVAQIDWRGDYLGGYVGIGYEWDLGRGFSMGPEFALVVAGVINKRPDRLFTGKPIAGRDSLALVPMFFWHIHYRF